MTLGDVARTAGVSRATASRVADGKSRVSPHSRQIVEKAIEALDYVPNPNLRPSLVSNSIGVVVTEPTSKLFGDPFFAPLLKGIYDALAERSLLLVMLAPNSSRDKELAQSYLTGHHVDGAILVSLHGDDPLPARLREQGIPTVICGRPPRGVKTSSVDGNNRQGGELATRHLIDLGRKRIAIISGNLDMASAVDRLMGYRDALAGAGIPLDPTLEEVADYIPDRAHMAMERLLLNHPDVDAVFCGSDHMAVAAMQVLQQSRKRIPEDVAIIGFDDTSAAWHARPALSSIRQPIEEMGYGAVDLLMREMTDPADEPRQVVFDTILSARASTVGTSS